MAIEPDVVAALPTTLERLRGGHIRGLRKGAKLFLLILRWRDDAKEWIAYALLSLDKEEPEEIGTPYRSAGPAAVPGWLRVFTRVEVARLRGTAAGREIDAAYLRAAYGGQLWDVHRDLPTQAVSWLYDAPLTHDLIGRIDIARIARLVAAIVRNRSSA